MQNLDNLSLLIQEEKQKQSFVEQKQSFVEQ